MLKSLVILLALANADSLLDTAKVVRQEIIGHTADSLTTRYYGWCFSKNVRVEVVNRNYLDSKTGYDGMDVVFRATDETENYKASNTQHVGYFCVRLRQVAGEYAVERLEVIKTNHPR